VSPSGKAAVFGTAMRRFESCHPKTLEATKRNGGVMQDNGNSDFLLFAGSSHPELSQEIANTLGVSLGDLDIKRFPDGEISIQIRENVRGRDVFVLQSVALNPNQYLMELLILIDALKRASARSINAVIPYYGYARQDRKDRPRVPITAKLVANMFENAGVSSVLTMDLHASQIEGFFNVPVDNLYGGPLLVEGFRQLDLSNAIVVAPDAGSVKLVRDFAAELGTGFAVLDKNRLTAEEVEVVTVIGNIEGKDVLLADDMCSTAGTQVSAAIACREKGAKRIYSAVTHGLFVGGAVEKIENSPIEVMLSCNTIPWTERLSGSTKIQYVSIAPLIAKAIKCILSRESVSSLSKMKCGAY
jgi:ribose-phosphate pyrophosphokinase